MVRKRAVAKAAFRGQLDATKKRHAAEPDMRWGIAPGVTRGQEVGGRWLVSWRRQVLADRRLPEADGFQDPSLGTRARAEPEAMAQIRVSVGLDVRAGLP
jgi:hypothetical protein